MSATTELRKSGGPRKKGLKKGLTGQGPSLVLEGSPEGNKRDGERARLRADTRVGEAGKTGSLKTR